MTYLASTTIADKHELESGSLSSHYRGCVDLMVGLEEGREMWRLEIVERCT